MISIRHNLLIVRRSAAYLLRTHVGGRTENYSLHRRGHTLGYADLMSPKSSSLDSGYEVARKWHDPRWARYQLRYNNS